MCGGSDQMKKGGEGKQKQRRDNNHTNKPL